MRWHPRAGRHGCAGKPRREDGTATCGCDLGRWIVYHRDASGRDYQVLIVQDLETGERAPLDQRVLDRMRNLAKAEEARRILAAQPESSLIEVARGGAGRQQIRDVSKDLAKALYNSFHRQKGYNVEKLNRDHRRFRQRARRSV